MRTFASTWVRLGMGLAVVMMGLAVQPAVLAGEADWLQKGAVKKLRVVDSADPRKSGDQEPDRRGKVTIRRLNPQCYSDWNNDPTALPYLFYQVAERMEGEQFSIYVDNAGLSVSSEDIFDYPIIYFTSHFAFSFSDDEVKNLQKYVNRGGTLWLDDCTGSGPFMDCVAQNVQRIVPGSELKLMDRNSEFFDLYNMIYPFNGVPDLGKEQFNRTPQAVYVKGRPAIIFCPNDYGCRWEISTPPTALNPLGEGAHQMSGDNKRELVYQFSINWLFYTLTH